MATKTSAGSRPRACGGRCPPAPAAGPRRAGAQGAGLDPWTYSPFYYLGTWTSHGTGFTAAPSVYWTFQHYSGNYGGNYQHVYRGLWVLGDTVPAVPAVGLAVLGGALVLGSLAALRAGG